MTLAIHGRDPRIRLAPDYPSLCEDAAARIAALVRAKPQAVLGLATGATPLGVYRALVRRRAEGLDFSRVICFNLDEYYPMAPENPQSYHHFMQEYLFRAINCCCWSVPDGRPRGHEEIARGCREYEERIAACGGIDLQLLGIGRTGHIGFNEPGSAPDSRTRLVTLHPATRQDASSAFGGLEHVPTEAITMGIRTILEARALVLLASGPGKARAVQAMWAAAPSKHIPASWTRGHLNLTLYLDPSAAGLLPAAPNGALP